MKLHIALAGLGLALAAGAAAAAEPAPQVRTERHVMIMGPGGPAELDKNGDGEVTRDEFMAPHAAVFGDLDADKNGKLSKDELGKGGVWRHGDGEGDDDRVVFMHGPHGPRGADGPGERRVQMFEMRGGPGGPEGMDANKDGKISPDEFAAPMKRAFESMDADKSGFLEEGERGKGPMRMKFEKKVETKEAQ